MAYSDFTAMQLAHRFGVKFKGVPLFANAKAVAPTAWLLETLRKGKELGFGSEKSRSERLVTPVLLELSDINEHSFSVYSGLNLDVDAESGLRGECDFIFSHSRIQDFITAPIFCITEAKKQDLEQGIVQCAAQLIAAYRYNQQEGAAVQTLYGCATTGVEWRFLVYQDNEIRIDEDRYLISELPQLLGVLQHIITASKPNVN